MLALRVVWSTRAADARTAVLCCTYLQALQVTSEACLENLVFRYLEASSIAVARSLPKRRHIPVALEETVE